MIFIGFEQGVFTFTAERNTTAHDNLKLRANFAHLQYSLKLKCYYASPEDLGYMLSLLDHYKHEYRFDHIALSQKEKLCEVLRQTELFRGEKMDPTSMREGIGYKLCFQEEDINRLVSKSRTMLWAEPGVGKTFEASVWASDLFVKGKIDRLFVVVKHTLLWHWQKELLRFGNYFCEDDFVSITTANKEEFLKTKKKVILIADHVFEEIVLIGAKKKRVKKLDPLTGKNKLQKKSNIQWSRLNTDLIKDVGGSSGAIIIDEAHKFAIPTSVRTKAMHRGIEGFRFRVLATATPHTSYFEKIWSLFQILDPSILNMDYKTFCVHIAKDFEDNGDIIYDGDKIYAIQKKIAPYIIKRRKKDDPNFKIELYLKPIWLKFPESYKEIYSSVAHAEILRFREKNQEVRWDRVGLKFPYLAQVLDCPILLHGKLSELGIGDLDKNLESIIFSNDPKVKFLEEILRDAKENNEKTVVFDWHPKTLNLCVNHFKKYGSIGLHGQDKRTVEEQEELINIFRDRDSEIQVLFANPQVFSEGVNLQIATKIIWFSLPQSSLIIKQGNERAYRADSTRDCEVLFPLYSETYDEYRYEKLNKDLEFNDEFARRMLSPSEIERFLMI